MFDRAFLFFPSEETNLSDIKGRQTGKEGMGFVITKIYSFKITIGNRSADACCQLVNCTTVRKQSVFLVVLLAVKAALCCRFLSGLLLLCSRKLRLKQKIFYALFGAEASFTESSSSNRLRRRNYSLSETTVSFNFFKFCYNSIDNGRYSEY